MERQSTHGGGLSICARFLRVDDLDVIQWFATYGPIRRSEDIRAPVAE